MQVVHPCFIFRSVQPDSVHFTGGETSSGGWPHTAAQGKPHTLKKYKLTPRSHLSGGYFSTITKLMSLALTAQTLQNGIPEKNVSCIFKKKHILKD